MRKLASYRIDPELPDSVQIMLITVHGPTGHEMGSEIRSMGELLRMVK